MFSVFGPKKLLHPVAARLALGLGGQRGGLLGGEERQSPTVVHCPVISSNEEKNLPSFLEKGNAAMKKRIFKTHVFGNG